MAKSKYSGRPGNKATRDRYKNEDRKEKNRLKKLKRHLKKFPNDKQAVAASETHKAYKAAGKNKLYPVTEFVEYKTQKSEIKTFVRKISREMMQVRAKVRRMMNAFSYEINRKKKEDKEDRKNKNKKYGLAEIFGKK